MSSAIKSLGLVQVGKESTAGTAVAATRKLSINGATWRRIEELEEFEDQQHGTLARTAVAPKITRNGMEIDIQQDLTYEQILLPLLSGFKGGVTPAAGSGTPTADQLWTFTLSPTADPAVDPYTIEFAELDAGSPDSDSMEAPYGVTTEIEISATNDAGISQIRHHMVGRKVQDTAFTAAQSLPTVQWVNNALWGFYVDDSWANLGNTQITGEVRGFTWALSGHIRPEYYLDGRSDLDFSKSGIGRRMVDLTVDIVVNPSAAGLIATEAADKTASTLRFISLLNTGPAISGGNPYSITLNGAYYHAADSMQERGSDADGNPIVRMHLRSAYDPTATKDLEVLVNNILTAFP